MAGRKWTPEQHKKFKKAMAARKSGPVKRSSKPNRQRPRDAIPVIENGELVFYRKRMDVGPLLVLERIED